MRGLVNLGEKAPDCACGERPADKGARLAISAQCSRNLLARLIPRFMYMVTRVLLCFFSGILGIDAVSKDPQENHQEHGHSYFVGDRYSNLYDARRYLFDVTREAIRRLAPTLGYEFERVLGA